MPWFKKPEKSLDFSFDPGAYPEPFRSLLRHLTSSLDALIARENAALQELDLPVPENRFKLRFKPSRVRDTDKIMVVEVDFYGKTLRFPKYEMHQFSHLGGHRIPDAMQRRLIKDEQIRKIVSHMTRPALSYVVTDPATLHECEPLRYGSAEEWLEFIQRRNGGVWCNRDPYGVLHALWWAFEEGPLKVVPESQPSDLFWPDSWTDLKPEQASTIPQLQSLARKANFLNSLTTDCPGHEWALPSDSNLDGNAPALNSNDIPDQQFPANHVTVKILPALEPLKPALCKEFLNALHGVTEGSIAFTIIATDHSVYCSLTGAERDVDAAIRQLEIFFPEACVLPHEHEGSGSYFCSAMAPRNAYHPLPALSTVDQYVSLFHFLKQVPPNESIAFQVIFRRLTPFVRQRMSDHISRFYERQTVGKEPSDPSFKETHKQITARANDFNKKLATFFVSVKVFGTQEHFVTSVREEFVFGRYQTESNCFLTEVSYESTGIDYSIPCWNVVNTDELAALVHLPSSAIKCEQLETTSMKAKLPPESFTTGGVAIGVSEAKGIKKVVSLPHLVRDRHLYIVGKSGTGKSTLIFNTALQDILRGDGVAVIDPHGDLVASGEQPLLNYIPEDRIEDTIYLNASDKENPVSMNLLKVSSDEELDLLASNLQTTFRRLSDTWGEKMDNVLRFALHTLVQTPGSTFFDLKRLLQNPEYRNNVVNGLSDPRLIDFWGNDFAAHRDSVQPIITRMGKFMLSPLYGMLSHAESNLSFYEVIQERKILLVNLGGIGEDDAQLLGSLLVSQLQLAVMQRGKLPPESRTPYYLYVDEFQNFTSRSFTKILSEARKYGLCLTLAHQFISQLGDAERDAIFGNIGTMIMFGVGDKDAQALRHQIGKFEPLDLSNLPKFQALCRPEQANDTFSFKTNAPPPKHQSFRDEIIQYTRDTYVIKTAPAPAGPPVSQVSRPAEPPPIHIAQLDETGPTNAQEVRPGWELPSQPPENLRLDHVSLNAAQDALRRSITKDAGLGRGGQQHRYLQQLIKRLAEDKGYRAIIEEPVLGGIGSVDVSLEREGRRIACEISVSSTCDYEFQNIQKCLAAGFDKIVVLSSEKKTLNKIEKLAVSGLDSETNKRILFFLPEDFVLFLEQSEAERTPTQTVRGYTVNVKYKASGNAEQLNQRQAIAQVILQALKRLKDET